jgi:hypothetical protein
MTWIYTAVLMVLIGTELDTALRQIKHKPK